MQPCGRRGTACGVVSVVCVVARAGVSCERGNRTWMPAAWLQALARLHAPAAKHPSHRAPPATHTNHVLLPPRCIAVLCCHPRMPQCTPVLSGQQMEYLKLGAAAIGPQDVSGTLMAACGRGAAMRVCFSPCEVCSCEHPANARSRHDVSSQVHGGRCIPGAAGRAESGLKGTCRAHKSTSEDTACRAERRCAGAPVLLDQADHRL